MIIRYPVVLLLVVLALGSGCEDANRWTKYRLTYKSRPVISDVLPLSNDTFFNYQASFEFNFKDDMEFRAVNPDKIEKARFYELQVAIKTDSPVNTFNFMRTLRIYLEGEGVPKRLIEEFESVPLSEKFLFMNLNETEGILDLLKSNTFRLIFEFNTDEMLQDEVHFEIDSRFEIDAKQFFI